MENLGSICDVLVVLVSFANLCYLIWARRKDGEEQKDRANAQKRYIWYREIVINHGIELIDDFFCECEHLLEHLQKENEKETIESFRKNLQKINKRLPNSIKVLDSDMAQKICRILENCEDIVTGYIDQFKQNSYFNIYQAKRRLKDEHYQIIALLYKEGFNI